MTDHEEGRLVRFHGALEQAPVTGATKRYTGYAILSECQCKWKLHPLDTATHELEAVIRDRSQKVNLRHTIIVPV